MEQVRQHAGPAGPRQVAWTGFVHLEVFFRGFAPQIQAAVPPSEMKKKHENR